MVNKQFDELELLTLRELTDNWLKNWKVNIACFEGTDILEQVYEYLGKKHLPVYEWEVGCFFPFSQYNL